MASMTIRNIPDEVHQQLKLRAARNDRSTEAEARHIIAQSIAESTGTGLGVQMRGIWGDNTGGELLTARSREEIREVSFE